MNRIERNFALNLHRTGSVPYLRLDRLIEKFHNESLLSGNDSATAKQTFVYIFDELSSYVSKVIKNLGRLRETHYWDVIIYTSSEFLYDDVLKLNIPLHNIVLKSTKVFMDLSLKSLIDVIKRPDYNRYDFYRSIPFQPGFFNHTCLSKIKKIHIAMPKLDDLYLPMAMAILDNENKRRKKGGNLEPMEIIFYPIYFTPNRLNYLNKDLKFLNFQQHYQISDRVEGDVYLSVLDDPESIHNCYFLYSEEDFSYRHPSVTFERCRGQNDRKWRTFQSPDEFYDRLNTDICNHNQIS
eukprot:TCONS_00005517-protein